MTIGPKLPLGDRPASAPAKERGPSPEAPSTPRAPSPHEEVFLRSGGLETPASPQESEEEAYTKEAGQVVELQAELQALQKRMTEAEAGA